MKEKSSVSDHPHPDERHDESTKVVRDRRRQARRTEEAHDTPAWTRDDFLHDLGRASRRVTREIESDPQQAAALDRSRRQAREGRLMSKEELERELTDDDES